MTLARLQLNSKTNTTGRDKAREIQTVKRGQKNSLCAVSDKKASQNKQPRGINNDSLRKY